MGWADDLDLQPLDRTDKDVHRPAPAFRFARRRRLAGPCSRPIFVSRPARRGHDGGSAKPERDRKRYGAAHKAHRVDHNHRQVADGDAVEQPDREAPDIHGEEADRDVAGGAAHVHPSRLE